MKACLVEEAHFESKCPAGPLHLAAAEATLWKIGRHTKKDDAQRAVAVVACIVIALMFAARLLGTCGQNCTAGRANHK
jgi:hypothetical protein